MWTKPGFILSSALVLGLAVGSGSSAGPVATPCTEANPVVTFNTIGGGQSPTNNPKVSTAVTGNIFVADSSDTRIKVCAGTAVLTRTTDSTGMATITKKSGDVGACVNANCVIASISVTSKYTVKSADGTDTDTLTFLPN